MFKSLRKSKKITKLFLIIIIGVVIYSILMIWFFFRLDILFVLIPILLTLMGVFFGWWKFLRGQLDKKMEKFYEIDGKEISKFIRNIENFRFNISGLDFINLKDKLENIKNFFDSEIKTRGYYILDSFYPTKLSDFFSRIKELSLKLNDKYEKLTESIENFHKKVINNPNRKCDINTWPYYLRINIIVKISEKLQFFPCLNSYKNYRNDDNYRQVYETFKSEIDEFIQTFQYEPFDLKFIEFLTKFHDILNQMHENYQNFLKENMIKLEPPTIFL